MELTVDQLSKSFNGQSAVDQLSFQLANNEVLGFLGPNGAGKSTTMKMITCFMAPSGGDIRANGASVFDDPAQFKARIGYLPESTPLYQDMFIIDYLDFVARLQGVSASQIPERTKQMISYTGLEAEKHKKIGELSKGFKQRVGLAQAMIHDPEVLILDEPTTGLDPNQIIEIRELIKQLGREKTILLSTHILPEVEAISDRILIINDGQITANGTPGELREQAEEQERLTVEIEAPDTAVETVRQTLAGLDGVEEARILEPEKGQYQLKSQQGSSAKKPVFNCCVQQGWYLLEQRSQETRLEDVFRQLTQ